MTASDKPHKPGWFQRWLGHDDVFDEALDPDDAQQPDSGDQRD